jgi:hypothetical protein
MVPPLADGAHYRRAYPLAALTGVGVWPIHRRQYLRPMIPTTLAPSRDRCLCPRCKDWVRPVRPHWKWRAAEVTFWLSCPVALMALKGFGVIAMPFLLLFAGGLAGPLRGLAGEEPRCPVCRVYLTEALKRPRPSTPLAR